MVANIKKATNRLQECHKAGSMKIILILLVFLMAGCSVSNQPKITKIRSNEKCIQVYLWYKDSRYVTWVDTLPTGWVKGARVTIPHGCDIKKIIKHQF